MDSFSRVQVMSSEEHAGLCAVSESATSSSVHTVQNLYRLPSRKRPREADASVLRLFLRAFGQYHTT
jgi:hypothetical protein